MKTEKNPTSFDYTILSNAFSEMSENGKKIITPMIIRTNDYVNLLRLETNRDVLKSHVSELINSMLNYGNLSIAVIAIIKELGNKPYFIDKQHGSEAARTIGISTTSYVIFVDTVKEATEIIRILNNTAKRWSMRQYILSGSITNIDYRKLLNYIKKYQNLTYVNAAAILMETNLGIAKKSLKNGNFEIKNERLGIQKFETIERMFQFTEMKKNSYTVEALTELFKNKGFDVYLRFEKEFLISLNDMLIRQRKTAAASSREAHLKDFEIAWDNM